jgi:hypothetical protein
MDSAPAKSPASPATRMGAVLELRAGDTHDEAEVGDQAVVRAEHRGTQRVATEHAVPVLRARQRFAGPSTWHGRADLGQDSSVRAARERARTPARPAVGGGEAEPLELPIPEGGVAPLRIRQPAIDLREPLVGLCGGHRLVHDGAVDLLPLVAPDTSRVRCRLPRHRATTTRTRPPRTRSAPDARARAGTPRRGMRPRERAGRTRPRRALRGAARTARAQEQQVE